MEKQKAEHLFKESERLFKEGHYQESLQYLAELNREYPQTFNILYPMLKCRVHLGRTDEAKELCAHMAKHFTDEKHQHKLQPIIAKLSAPPQSAQPAPPGEPGGIAPGAVDIDSYLDAPPSHAQHPVEPPQQGFSIEWKKWAIYGGIVAAILAVFIALPLVMLERAPSETAQSAPANQSAADGESGGGNRYREPPTLVDRIISGLVSGAINIAVVTVFAFLVLLMMSTVSMDSIKEDGGAILGITAIAQINFFIPHVLDLGLTFKTGFGIAALFQWLKLLQGRFDLTCGQLFIFFIVYAVVKTGMELAFFVLVVGGSLAGLAVLAS